MKWISPLMIKGFTVSRGRWVRCNTHLGFYKFGSTASIARLRPSLCRHFNDICFVLFRDSMLRPQNWQQNVFNGPRSSLDFRRKYSTSNIACYRYTAVTWSITENIDRGLIYFEYVLVMKFYGFGTRAKIVRTFGAWKSALQSKLFRNTLFSYVCVCRGERRLFEVSLIGCRR